MLARKARRLVAIICIMSPLFMAIFVSCALNPGARTPKGQPRVILVIPEKLPRIQRTLIFGWPQGERYAWSYPRFVLNKQVVPYLKERFPGLVVYSSVPAYMKYDLAMILKLRYRVDNAALLSNSFNFGATAEIDIDLISSDGSRLGSISTDGAVQDSLNPYDPLQDDKLHAANEFLKSLGEGLRESVGKNLDEKFDSPSIRQIFAEALTRREGPCALELSAEFRDQASILPNRRLDAGEIAVIAAKVVNRGPGTAQGVSLIPSSKMGGINLGKIGSLGNIQSGEEQEVIVPVGATLDVKSGAATVLLEAHELRGFNAPPIQLDIPVGGLLRPSLEFSDFTLNDRSGLAVGDGDGRISNGETVEIIFLVRNSSRSDAGRVAVKVEKASPGIAVPEAPQDLGVIPADQARQARFLLRLPPAFNEPKLDLRFTAIEGRGDQVAKAEVSRTWDVTIRRPAVVVSHRIFDGNSPASSGNRDSIPNNGEVVEIELTPSNRGVVAAGAVRIKLLSGAQGISLTPPDISIGDLPASSLGAPQRVRLQIPRTFRGGRIPLELKIEQKDFPENLQEILLPVEILTPELALDVEGISHIQQGERQQLTFQIENRGTLEARGVEIEATSHWQGLDILSGSKDSLGVLGPYAPAAPSHIDLYARPGAKLGTATLTVSVRQADFPPLVKKIEIPITDRPPIMVAVDPAPPQASRAGASTRPVIFFRNYMSGQIVASEKVTLSFEVQDAKGLSWVEVIQDERKISSERTLSEPAQDLGVVVNRYSAVLALRPGKNVVTVTAVNQDGVKSEASLSLTRPAERQQVWAVVIGVSRYEDSSIRPLGFADSDAESFRRYLVNSLGVPENHISMLVNEDATRRKIVQAIGDELRTRAEHNDTVFVYFAGHGASEPDRQSGDGASKYLLPHETERTSYNSTALSIEDLERQLDRIEAGRVVVILDSCFSGAAGGRTIFEGAVRSRGPLSDDFLRRIAESGRGRVLLTASDVNEVAEERRDLGRGVFTHFLLEGLAGSADRSPFGNGDGVISVDETYAYTSRKVREATKNQQNPQKFGHVSGELLIGKTPEKGARP